MPRFRNPSWNTTMATTSRALFTSSMMTPGADERDTAQYLLYDFALSSIPGSFYTICMYCSLHLGAVTGAARDGLGGRVPH